MMKKRVSILGVNTSIVLMMMVFFGSLFSGCYTKDDIPVEPTVPEPTGGTHIVNVFVYDVATGDEVTGATIKSHDGGEVVGKTIKKKWGGVIAIEVEANGYKKLNYTLDLPVISSGELTQSIALGIEKEVANTYNVNINVKDADGNELTTGATIYYGDFEEPINDGSVTLDPENLKSLAGTICSFMIIAEGYNPYVFDLAIPADASLNLSYIATLSKKSEATTFGGYVYDGVSKAPVAGGTVYYAVGNTEELKQVNLADGYFEIPGIDEGTIIALLVDVEGYRASWRHVKVAAQTVDFFLFQKSEGETASSALAGVAGGEEVKEALNTTSSGADVLALENEFILPAGISFTLDGKNIQTVAVGVQVNGKIMEEKKTASFASFEGTPAGLNFEGGKFLWRVKNPFTKNVDVKWQYMGEKEEEGMVTLDKEGYYEAALAHFSSYKMVLSPEHSVETDSTSNVEDLYFWSKDGNPVSDPSFDYVVKSGADEWVVNTSDSKLDNVVEKVISANSFDKVKEENAIYKAEGWSVKGDEMLHVRKTVVKITHTFDFGDNVSVEVVEYQTLIAPVTILPKDPHHTHGGHFTEGGAGGGNGGTAAF